MKSSSIWNRKVQLGFGAAILTLLGAGVISYKSAAAGFDIRACRKQFLKFFEELVIEGRRTGLFN